MRVNGSAGDNSIQSCRGIPAHHPLLFSSAFPSDFALTLSPAGGCPGLSGNLTQNAPNQHHPSGPIRERFAEKHVRNDVPELIRAFFAGKPVRNGVPELIRACFAGKHVRNGATEGIRTDSAGKHVRNGPLELIRACFARKPVRNGGMIVLFTENKAIAGKWHLRL